MNDTGKNEVLETENAAAVTGRAATHAKGFITGDDFIRRYCEAFGLEACDDRAVNSLVYNTAHNCPICGAKPRMFWNAVDVETPAAIWSKHAGRKTMVIAGTVLCKCGRSSMYYDERRDTNLHAPNALVEPQRFAGILINTWNNRKP